MKHFKVDVLAFLQARAHSEPICHDNRTSVSKADSTCCDYIEFNACMSATCLF